MTRQSKRNKPQEASEAEAKKPKLSPEEEKGKEKDNDGGEFFKVGKIPYEGPSSRNPLSFKYFNAEEEILGKKMKDWLRFAVCYWHTWRGNGSDMFGAPTFLRPWEDSSDSLENAIRRVKVHFEFLQKLGVEYYCFHDADVAPEGKDLQETNENIDKIVEVMKAEQERTGIKLLWGTANLFSHPRYMNGAATNPDALVFARAAAQVKKALEITHKLGGENYVFWGGREGYFSLLNTDMKMELDHLANFLKMAVDYKAKLGANFQFLIEPKPREPTAHQYDFDAATTISFLKTYGLEDHFKLNLEANHATLAGHTFEHEITMASQYGKLGSIDANHNESMLGWDTDLFPTDVKMATYVMQIVVEQGGLAPGGLNFDCKVRRESTDPEDLFAGHVNGMDTFARGLRNYAKIKEEGILAKMKKERYRSYTEGIGEKIHKGTTNFEELEKVALEAEPQKISAAQEKYEGIFGSYC